MVTNPFADYETWINFTTNGLHIQLNSKGNVTLLKLFSRLIDLVEIHLQHETSIHKYKYREDEELFH